MKIRLVTILLLCGLYSTAQETISFPSKDGLMITADLYEIKSNKPLILMCHQAGYSRGEYVETAVKLNQMGYSCLAIDQRSGSRIGGLANETAQRAVDKKLPGDYLDALQDIEAAVDFAYEKYKKPIYIMGSSYSASLAMVVGNRTNKIAAIMAYSPGEYFNGELIVADEIKGLAKPIYITSARFEANNVSTFVNRIDTKYVTHYIPNVKGLHGSKTLWKSTDGYEQFWESLSKFLDTL